MESNLKQLKNIRNTIQRYLEQHPHASDTAEGVMIWLERQNFEDTFNLVKEALDQMVQEGTLARRVQGNGRVTFSAPQSTNKINE